MTQEKEAKSKFIIDSEFIEPPEGLVVKNWVFDGEPLFKHKERKHKLIHFVLHETAGRSADGCKRTLLKKGYGVQLILERDGTISCHGDLLTDRMVHANHLNNTAIGIEVVNPYAPSIAKGMDFDTIPAEWWTWCPKIKGKKERDRRYVLPTEAQLKALSILIPFLCEKLGIPYEFPTADLNKKNRKVKKTGWRMKRTPGPGVIAHQDFATHADGRYLLEYLIKQTQLSE